MMKMIAKSSLNDSLMTGFFVNNKLQKIKFEKFCYTKEGKKVICYGLNLYIESVPEEKFLYNLKVGITSDSENSKEKIFDLGNVERFNHFSYEDTNTLEKKVIDIPSEHPSIEKIWENPVLSPLFRDFMTAYTPSGIDNPIDIESIYANRLYYPREDFEKLLYSRGHNNNLLNQVKNVYKNERIK